MKTKTMLSASAAVCALAAALPQGHALTQTEQEPERQETQQRGPAPEVIMVTATRRAESVQDVPLSISTLSQDDLNEKGIVGYEGLAYETPGVVLNKPTANFNNFTARGVATNGYNANLQSPVAIYIDELPISANGNSTILDPSLFDVERIEFLRGPQGTLFGAGSLSGALRIITKEPDPGAFAFSALGDVGVTGSESVRQRYNAMVNIPLVEDKLALRVVGFHRNEEGYVDNIGTGVENANTLEAWGGRATLLWEPTDRLSMKLMVSHEDSEPRDSALTNPQLGTNVRRSDRPDLFTGEMTNYNGTLEYQFDSATLTSSTTYSRFNQKFYVDLAGTFAQAIAFGLDADAYDQTFVEEVRLVSDGEGAFDWVLGGFYFERKRDVDFGYRSSPEFLEAAGITGLPDEYYQQLRNHTLSHEAAVFGELTYRFNEDFWVTGGLRYGRTDAQTITEGGYNSNYLANALAGVSGPLTVTPIQPEQGDKAEETGPSYRASISWRPRPSVTTYATIATGFRAPVVNAYGGQPSLTDPEDLIIPEGADPDELVNYEAGVKGSWFDNRVNANVAVYYIDWNDIQVQANRVSDSVQFATNIGGATSRGIELDLTVHPTQSLTIGLKGSVNDAEVDTLSEEEAAISGAVSGARLAGPRFQGSLLLNYAFGLMNAGEGNASFAVRHVGSFPGSFPNVPGQPGTTSPTFDYTESFTAADAALAAAFDRWTVGLYAENIFDDRSINYVHPEAFLDSRYGRVAPRTIGLRVGYGF